MSLVGDGELGEASIDGGLVRGEALMDLVNSITSLRFGSMLLPSGVVEVVPHDGGGSVA
jgi:hypothetical protein